MTLQPTVFRDLPMGETFLLDGELAVKLERDVRHGMLHCTNARTAGGRFILVDEDQPVGLPADPPL